MLFIRKKFLQWADTLQPVDCTWKQAVIISHLLTLSLPVSRSYPRVTFLYFPKHLREWKNIFSVQKPCT